MEQIKEQMSLKAMSKVSWILQKSAKSAHVMQNYCKNAFGSHSSQVFSQCSWYCSLIKNI